MKFCQKETRGSFSGKLCDYYLCNYKTTRNEQQKVRLYDKLNNGRWHLAFENLMAEFVYSVGTFNSAYFCNHLWNRDRKKVTYYSSIRKKE